MNYKILLITIFHTTFLCSTPSISHTPVCDQQSTITISIPLKQNDWLYKEYLNFSIDNPNISLSLWKADHLAESKYDAHFQETKKVFTHPTTITLTATTHTHECINTYLHMTYYLKSEKKIVTKSFPIIFNQPVIAEPELIQAIEVPTQQHITPHAQQETEQSTIKNSQVTRQDDSPFFKTIQGWWKIIVTYISPFILFFICTLFLITFGIISLVSARKESSTTIKKIKNYVGQIALASSVFALFKAVQFYIG